MNITNHKKGYFFILDAFVAGTIIAFTLVAIMNSDVAVSKRATEYTQADAIVQFLLDTKIEDLDNQYVKSLMANGTITNARNSVMEQIDLFYYTSQVSSGPDKLLYRNLSLNLLKNI